MNNKKKFDVTFFMNNGDVFRMFFTARIIDEVLEYFQENSDVTFIGSVDQNSFINMKNVNYFEVKERESE